MAGRGTGVPVHFACFVARRNQTYDVEAGRTSARLGYRHPKGHERIVRTGRTRPTKTGNMPPRKLFTTYEYECECGHVGWSCVSGVEKLPLKELMTEATLVASMVGHTIVAATWADASPDREWQGHEEATLTLDDGRVIQFGGWGYDAWGATVTLLTGEDTS